MSDIPTVKVKKGDSVITINQSDLRRFAAEGWKPVEAEKKAKDDDAKS